MSTPKLGFNVSLKKEKPLSETVRSINTSTVIEVTHAGMGSEIHKRAAKIKSATTRCCVPPQSGGAQQPPYGQVPPQTPPPTTAKLHNKNITRRLTPNLTLCVSSPKKYLQMLLIFL